MLISLKSLIAYSDKKYTLHRNTTPFLILSTISCWFYVKCRTDTDILAMVYEINQYLLIVSTIPKLHCQTNEIEARCCQETPKIKKKVPFIELPPTSHVIFYSFTKMYDCFQCNWMIQSISLLKTLNLPFKCQRSLWTFEINDVNKNDINDANYNITTFSSIKTKALIKTEEQAESKMGPRHSRLASEADSGHDTGSSSSRQEEDLHKGQVHRR